MVAVTENVYEVPFVKPPTVIGEVDALAVRPPGLLVTVYPVIGEPPAFAGTAKLTDAWASPAVAVTPVGADGAVTVGGVTVPSGCTQFIPVVTKLDAPSVMYPVA